MAELAFVLLLAGHLLTVNVAAAGPLVCIWFEWREGRGNELAGSVGRQLAAVAIVSMIIGTLLGFLIGWHNWTPAYKQLVLHLGSRVSWGVVELVFSFLLMILHLWWWYLPAILRLGRAHFVA